ncbi:MAG TPA: VCBS repeat-containing protein, partial [Nitrosopumilaceae archaeon]|nr:VCBS repeat-containing protein [Nitrosopumilaceae archaeon]
YNMDGKIDLAIANYTSHTISVLFGTGTGTFLPSVYYSLDYITGGGPVSLTSADFNGDTKNDIAVANEFGDNISILLNNGVGIFNDTLIYGAGHSPAWITSDDFNGDGKTDLVVTNLKDNSCSILLSKGGGSFLAPPNYYPGYGEFLSISKNDFNGDTFLDLAITNYTDTTFSILLNDGVGNFSKGTYKGGIQAEALASADFNADGKPDIITGPDYYTGHFNIYLNNGTGGFNSIANHFYVGTNNSTIVTSDFNGDGMSDIAVNNSVGIAVFLATGLATFSTANTYSFSAINAQMTVLDFNADGKLDIAVGVGNGFSLLQNNGFGGFISGSTYNLGFIQTIGITSGDFNNDGFIDLAVIDKN